jgi:Protein O-mannosyl-transferase TMEM260-like
VSERPRAISWGLPLAAGVVLLAVYAWTLAPDITFWDAGEFIAAAKTLGIPHPPGTPLFVLMLAVWAKLLAFLSFSLATNLFSAVVTSVAAVLSARLVARGTGDSLSGAAGALCAGSMTSVWLNATETEVYAASLALAVLTLASAERAGRTGSTRWRVFVAYLMALAVPLHLSALLAAPAAVYLAATGTDERVDVPAASALSGVFLASAGIGTARWWVCGAGVLLVLLSPLASRVVDGARRRGAATAPTPPATTIPERRVAASAWAPALSALGVALVALSVVVFMLVRARHDPAINQGNPVDWRTLEYVIARKQYLVAPLFPRQAPWWLQIANLFEYVDWQVALSLAPGVVPSVGRIAFTVLFLGLGVVGSVEHRRRDGRTWSGLALLTFFGTIGAVSYLNLKASPSFGWGVIPNDALREARERDYFFVLGFWGWGLWAGTGAVAVVRRLRWRPAVGVTLAALPIALNWAAVERKGEPESELPRRFGEAVLRDAPPNAVLFVGGDNDTYTLWALQQVNALRRDVSVVTLPLLNAGWNQREVGRRWGLFPTDEPTRPALDAARRMAAAAVKQGRPVAVDVMVTAAERERIGGSWVVSGMVVVARGPGVGAVESSSVSSLDRSPSIDTAATRRSADAIATWRHGSPRLSTDPVSSYMLELLGCPALYLVRDATAEQIRSLDSTCNRR